MSSLSRKGAMMCGFGSKDKNNHRQNASDSAMDILDMRYAIGEIDKEEYEEKKSILTGPSDYSMHLNQT